ncbi:MAG: lipid-binding SYLF domain-containing protein [Candidatus Omnitrophica bacterium]|nr:lipid-binding SYLF domain-containing protein [Candidatus Omnitrophota bacterium]
MKKISLLLLIFFAVSSVNLYADKWDDLLIESARVFEEMAAIPEEGIPAAFVKKSYAMAIFPSTIGGGFVFGGKYGQGVILAKNDKGTWSAPCVFNLAGVSWGMQIGGQATDIVLVIMNERGLNGLLNSKLKLGADASIAAGPVGRDAEAATDLTLKSEILSYSRSRGAFIGVKLEGSVISANETANSDLYGAGLTAKDILIDGKVSPTVSAERLIKDLNEY